MATISAGDEEIGDVIADAIEKVGKDGVVNVEEGQTFGMDLEFTEGMQFDKGYISPYMVTDQDRMEGVLEDPYILIANQKIGSVRDILPILEQVIQSGKAILIIAEDVEGETLATLVVNKLRGTFTGVAVKAPGFGDRRKRMLEDIAILTGGEVITEEMGLKLENTQLTQLGRARRVVVTKDTTTIVDGAGDSAAIKGRINQIKNEVENTDSDFDREKLQERLAKLSGGVAVVKVGAATETEMKEKKHRVEDALQATRAALEEGIVPGGGVALLQASSAVTISDNGSSADGSDDERTGAQDRPARPGGAAPSARRERGPRGLGRRQRRPQGQERPRPERGHQRDRRSRRRRDHRPGDGDALCSAERGLDRQEHPHHRGDRRRGAREGSRRRRRRHAGHERHDVGRTAGAHAGLLRSKPGEPGCRCMLRGPGRMPGPRFFGRPRGGSRSSNLGNSLPGATGAIGMWGADRVGRDRLQARLRLAIGLAAAATLLAWAFSQPAMAASCGDEFTGASGGSWATPSNWSAGVPSAGTVVCWGAEKTVAVSEGSQAAAAIAGGGGLLVEGSGRLALAGDAEASSLSGGIQTAEGGQLEVGGDVECASLQISGGRVLDDGRIGCPVKVAGGTLAGDGAVAAARSSTKPEQSNRATGRPPVG